MTELLPCPFCGGAAEFERLGTHSRSCIIACTDCSTRHETGEIGGNCGRSWNTRATAAPVVVGEDAKLVLIGYAHASELATLRDCGESSVLILSKPDQFGFEVPIYSAALAGD